MDVAGQDRRRGLMVRERTSHVRSGGQWGFMSGHMRGSQWLWVFT